MAQKKYKNKFSVFVDRFLYVFQAVILIFATSTGLLTSLFPAAVSAAPGDGHMLLFWDGGSDPTDWTCVSCSIGDDFYQRFPRGEASYGGTGGSVNHNHTASGSIDATTTTMPARSKNPPPNEIRNNDHAHTASPTVENAGNLPSYRQLKIIRHDSSGDPATIPAGAIAMFDTTVPSGWTQYSAQNGYYPRGEGTATTTGGSDTHSNSITGTSGAATGGDREQDTNGTPTNIAAQNHTHDIAGSATTVNQEPPYLNTILGKITSDGSPPNDMYAMWDDDPTTDWVIKSESGTDFHQKFIKGSATYGGTGGATTHTHANTTYASGVPSGTTTSRDGGTGNASDDLHTHTVNVTGFSTDNHVPPYINVIVAKLQQPSTLELSGFRWFANQDNTDVGSALAAQDTAANAPRQGKAFRLRFLVHVSGQNYGLNGESMKLQFATKSGTCDTSFIGESYSDVATGAGAIRYYDNSTPSDNTALTSNGSDPTHSSDTIRDQSYEESNNFNNSQAAVSIGADGLWDLSLVDFSAAASTSYCFRIIRSGGGLLDTYSVIPEITTDDGQGHMILLWDGGAAPSGWSCVSCNSGDDFYQKFIRGEAAFGATGGAADHTHTASGSTGSESSKSGRSNSGTGFIETHTHNYSPIIGNTSNSPAYRQLNLIRFDTSGTPSSIPANAIAIFDAAVPGGWTRYGAQDGNYIRGENTATTTGGSNTHTNTITGSTGIGTGTAVAQDASPTQGPAATEAHTHTVSGNTDSVNIEPPYINTILGKKNLAGAAPSNMLAIWDGSFPGVWTSQSGSGGPFYQTFMKPAATYGGTGGAVSHSHANTNITTSIPSATANSRTGAASLTSSTHTHSASITGFSTDNHLPPYTNSIIAKLTGINISPNSPTSLDQIRTSDSASISVGGYANGSQVKFTANASDTDNPDDLQLCVEVQQTGTAFTNTPTMCGSAVTYSGTPVAVSVTIGSLSDATNYHWQARIKDGAGATSAWVSFGANPEANADFIMDSTDPGGTVYDGSTTDVDIEYNDGTLDELEANWDITDSGSGILLYEYSIGTTVGATDVVGWTSNGTTDFITAGSLSLQTSQAYFFNIRTTDNADNQNITSSDGQFVAPSLDFSTSAGGVVFDNLNSGNGYTDSVDTTIITSTNAHNGYTVRLWATGLLQNIYGDTIGMFDGGTYASPDEWLGGDRGYGYTSSDTLIQGVNIFNPVICAGGGNGSCYAPINQSAPGDIIADNESVITGTPITNEQFTITHRVATDSGQVAGRYETVLIFSASAIY